MRSQFPERRERIINLARRLTIISSAELLEAGITDNASRDLQRFEYEGILEFALFGKERGRRGPYRKYYRLRNGDES